MRQELAISPRARPHQMPGPVSQYSSQRSSLFNTQSAGRKSHVFQPPRSPTALAPSLGNATATLTPLVENRTRKRIRPGSPAKVCNQIARTRDWSNGNEYDVGSTDLLETPRSVLNVDSPAPLANTTYMLAGGGLDLTSSPIVGASERNRGVDDSGFRTNWSAIQEQRSERQEKDCEPNRGALGIPVQASDYRPTVASQDVGWGRIVFQLVGNVAERMWEFCRTGAFKGFYAGGGEGYEIRQTQSLTRETQDCGSTSMDLDERLRSTDISGQGNLHVPGRIFPLTATAASSPNNLSPERGAKRIHTESGWVMVSNNGSELSQRSSPQVSTPHRTPYTSSATSTPRSRIPRPKSTGVSPFGRPAGGSLSRGSPGTNGFYFASPRRQSGSWNKPNNIVEPLGCAARHGKSPTAAVATAMGVEERRKNRHSIHANSPPFLVPREHYETQAKSLERPTDRSVRIMNQQVTAMIREGRQALQATSPMGRRW